MKCPTGPCFGYVVGPEPTSTDDLPPSKSAPLLDTYKMNEAHQSSRDWDCTGTGLRVLDAGIVDGTVSLQRPY